MQEKLDKKSIAELVNDIDKNFNAGNPDSLKAYLKNLSIEKETAPIYDSCIKIDGQPRWILESPDKGDLIQERVSFPSLITKDGQSDTAFFYIYRKSDFKNRDVILWIPGFRVSDFGFKFIKKFFRIELLNDYDIVFYVPPYHLERKINGKNDGDGFFSANTQQNINMLLNMTREIRTMYKYLKSKNVKSISGWGASTGASSVLIASSFDYFEHLSLMIPVVDWANIALDNPMMKNIDLRLTQNGFSDSFLRQAYSFVSPINYKSLTKPDNIHIQYSELDQLIPANIITSYCTKFGIKKKHAYKTSHGTILLSSKMFADYKTFLDSLKKFEQ
jgi:hypothetical protein